MRRRAARMDTKPLQPPTPTPAQPMADPAETNIQLMEHEIMQQMHATATSFAGPDGGDTRVIHDPGQNAHTPAVTIQQTGMGYGVAYQPIKIQAVPAPIPASLVAKMEKQGHKVKGRDHGLDTSHSGLIKKS